MKKSIISVILSVAMLAMMCVPSFVAAATYYQTVSFMGFDDYNASTYHNKGLVVYENFNNVSAGTGPNGTGDTALSVTSKNANGKLRVYYADGNVSASSSKTELSGDRIRFSYDFYADVSSIQLSSVGRFFKSYVTMGTNNNSEGDGQWKITPQFFYNNDKESVRLKIGDTGTQDYFNVPHQRWYHVEHVFDFTKLKDDSMDIAIKVTDNVTGSDVAHWDYDYAQYESGKDGTNLKNIIKYVYFEVGGSDHYNANFIFDNFRFEKLVEITQPYAKAYKYNTSTEAVNNLIPYSASNIVIDLGGNKLNNEDITTDNIILTANGEAVAKDKYSVAYSDGVLVITPVAGTLKANTILDVKISSAVKIADADIAIGEDAVFSLYVGDDNLLYVERTLDATSSKISATIKAVNSKNTDTSITVITAGYTSNELIDVIVPQVITIPASSVKEEPVSLNMTSAYSYAKLFVLSDMTSLKPLIAEKTASVTE